MGAYLLSLIYGSFYYFKAKKTCFEHLVYFCSIFFFSFRTQCEQTICKSDDGFVIQEITILMFGLHQFGFKKSQHPF